MALSPRPLRHWLLIASAALVAASCNPSVVGAPCHSDDQCPTGQSCHAGACAVGPPSPAPADGGVPDAGPPDSGPVDAGRPDAGHPDAGHPDAGRPDAGPMDAGPPDSGPADAGPADAGPADAGPADAGPPDAGVITPPCPLPAAQIFVDPGLGSTAARGATGAYMPAECRFSTLGAALAVVGSGGQVVAMSDGIAATVFDHETPPLFVPSSVSLTTQDCVGSGCEPALYIISMAAAAALDTGVVLDPGSQLSGFTVTIEDGGPSIAIGASGTGVKLASVVVNTASAGGLPDGGYVGSHHGIAITNPMSGGPSQAELDGVVVRGAVVNLGLYSVDGGAVDVVANGLTESTSPDDGIALTGVANLVIDGGSITGNVVGIELVDTSSVSVRDVSFAANANYAVNSLTEGTLADGGLPHVLLDSVFMDGGGNGVVMFTLGGYATFGMRASTLTRGSGRGVDLYGPLHIAQFADNTVSDFGRDAVYVECRLNADGGASWPDGGGIDLDGGLVDLRNPCDAGANTLIGYTTTHYGVELDSPAAKAGMVVEISGAIFDENPPVSGTDYKNVIVIEQPDGGYCPMPSPIP